MYVWIKKRRELVSENFPIMHLILPRLKWVDQVEWPLKRHMCMCTFETRSTETVHTSTKAHLTSVAISVMPYGESVGIIATAAIWRIGMNE